MPANRRKRLIRAAIVLLVLVVLVVLPSYVSTLPWFYAKFTTAKAAHAAWKTSTHAEASCESCHVRPGVFSQVSYRVRALGAAYMLPMSHTRPPKTFAKPTNVACVRCHIDLRAVSPKGDLQIPHRAHVSILKMACVDCHGYLVHDKSPEGEHTPPMSGCLTCHDGEKADNACTACHTGKATPASHRQADWTVVHASKRNDPECPKCHAWTANWCVDCHSRRPRSHGAGWRNTHGAAVERHRNCEACHVASFCVRCHGELPKLNYDPAVKLVK